jgi:hypothetical protein
LWLDAVTQAEVLPARVFRGYCLNCGRDIMVHTCHETRMRKLESELKEPTDD